jgi:transcriptional regulator with XRE-family HTH domain
MELGPRIRSLRVAKGLTQEALAKKLRIDQGQLSRIEAGKAGLSVKRLQSLAKHLGVEPSALLSHTRAA